MSEPDTSLLIAQLRLLGDVATRKGAIATANVVLLAAARLEALEAEKTAQRLNARNAGRARWRFTPHEERSARMRALVHLRILKDTSTAAR